MQSLEPTIAGDLFAEQPVPQAIFLTVALYAQSHQILPLVVCVVTVDVVHMQQVRVAAPENNAALLTRPVGVLSNLSAQTTLIVALLCVSRLVDPQMSVRRYRPSGAHYACLRLQQRQHLLCGLARIALLLDKAGVRGLEARYLVGRHCPNGNGLYLREVHRDSPITRGLRDVQVESHNTHATKEQADKGEQKESRHFASLTMSSSPTRARLAPSELMVPGRETPWMVKPRSS